MHSRSWHEIAVGQSRESLISILASCANASSNCAHSESAQLVAIFVNEVGPCYQFAICHPTRAAEF